MIVITDKFKTWINDFGNQEKAANFLGVTRTWLNTVLGGANVGEEFIELVKNKTGWDFEKAFELVDSEKKDAE